MRMQCLLPVQIANTCCMNCNSTVVKCISHSLKSTNDHDHKPVYPHSEQGSMQQYFRTRAATMHAPAVLDDDDSTNYTVLRPCRIAARSHQLTHLTLSRKSFPSVFFIMLPPAILSSSRRIRSNSVHTLLSFNSHEVYILVSLEPRDQSTIPAGTGLD